MATGFRTHEAALYRSSSGRKESKGNLTERREHKLCLWSPVAKLNQAECEVYLEVVRKVTILR